MPFHFISPIILHSCVQLPPAFHGQRFVYTIIRDKKYINLPALFPLQEIQPDHHKQYIANITFYSLPVLCCLCCHQLPHHRHLPLVLLLLGYSYCVVERLAYLPRKPCCGPSFRLFTHRHRQHFLFHGLCYCCHHPRKRTDSNYSSYQPSAKPLCVASHFPLCLFFPCFFISFFILLLSSPHSLSLGYPATHTSRDLSHLPFYFPPPLFNGSRLVTNHSLHPVILQYPPSRSFSLTKGTTPLPSPRVNCCQNRRRRGVCLSVCLVNSLVGHCPFRPSFFPFHPLHPLPHFWRGKGGGELVISLIQYT